MPSPLPSSRHARLLAAALGLALSFPALAAADSPSPAVTDSPSPAPRDPWGSSRGTNPYAGVPAGLPPGYRMERDATLIRAGAVAMGAGFFGGLTGLVLTAQNTECQYGIFCQTRDRGLKTGADVTMVVSALTLLAGIPLLVVGLQKRPVPPAALHALGRPAPGGWGWSF